MISTAARAQHPLDGQGARIEYLPGNHVCGLFRASHPLSGNSFGAPNTITPLVDLWTEGQQLPGYMRQ